MQIERLNTCGECSSGFGCTSVVESAKQVGQSKNDRVNAMAAANAGFDI
ncbi:hypothetical protein I5592_18860 [Acinetobacter baumannii]|nr:hypothetical protein I5592_18860 [Acinetobacter baumannii]